jgi:radical SAM protein with 4Fe4S-binding SPASM domain
MVHMAADLGVDRLWVQGLSHEFTDVADDEGFVRIRRWTERHQLTAAEIDDVTSRAAAVARQLGVDLRLPESPASAPPRRPDEPGCDWPWRSAYVNHDGTVQPCCMLMGRQRGRLGNVFEQPISELWHTEPYVELRAALLGPTPPAMCEGCAVHRRRF